MNYEIRHISNKKGNGLFATEFIPSGSIIFEEEPLVSAQFSWNAAYGYKACDHCLRPLETAEENVRRLTNKSDIVLPHIECCTINKARITECSACGIQYCSPECLQRAFELYHQILCKQSKCDTHPLDVLNEAWKHVHYPPETSTIMIIPRIIAMIQQSPTKDETLQTFLRFVHKPTNEDDQLVHKLLGERFTMQINTLYELMQSAIPNAGVEELLTADGFHSLLALIGTNGQGVGSSAIGRWATDVMELPLNDEEKQVIDDLIDKLYEDMNEHSGEFLNNEGIALYSLQSKCNHSCSPNAEVTFPYNSNRLSLVALKDIQEGEEICNSYLDECMLERSRHTRQKELKLNYLFLCECEKCIEEADEVDEDMSD